MDLLHISAFSILERTACASQEAGEVFVIGNGGCGQLGMGEDDVDAVRARLSSIATGAKVRLYSLADSVNVPACRCIHNHDSVLASRQCCLPPTLGHSTH